MESQWEKISISGYVTKPTATRGNRSLQFFFVNGRYIKSRTLCAALEEAYKNQMMVGRFPACVLHITLPVEAVDVNVHPAKTEVRFLSERSVFDAVHYGVLSALNKTPGAPEMRLPEKQEPKQSAAAAPQKDYFKTMTTAEYRASVPGAAHGGFASDVQLPKHEPVTLPARPEKPVVIERPEPEERPAPVRMARPVNIFPDEMEAELLTGVPAVSAEKTLSRVNTLPAEPEAEKAAAEEDAPEEIMSSAAPEAPAQDEIPLQEEPWRVIGEALDTYIIVEQAGSVIFIDKHAAHERILFEKFRKQSTPVMSQTLLAPIPAGLTREEASAALENAALLERYGFGVENFAGAGREAALRPDARPRDAP